MSKVEGIPERPVLASGQGEAALATRLLERVLRVAERGQYRDGAHLNLNTHPVFDDVREYLAALPETKP